MSLTAHCKRALAVTLSALAGLSCGAHAVESASKVAVVTVQSPAGLQGTFQGVFANFSAGAPPSEDLVAWVPSGDLEGCAEFPPAPAHLAGRALVAVVRRGTCTFDTKALQAQSAGAKGIVIVNNNDELTVMASVNETRAAEIGIFVVGVQKSLGDNIISWSETHQDSDPVAMSVAIYNLPSNFDFAEFLLMCLATSLVVAGALFSTADLREASFFAPRAEEVVEIDSKAAIGFFAIGSAALVVLYFFMKYLIYVVIFGFCLGGASCITQIVSNTLKYLVPPLRERNFHFPVVGALPVSALIAVIPASAVVLTWFFSRNTAHAWFLQDIMGAGFLCMLQQTIRLPNIKIATCFLTLMFFFDIFWVFISPLFFRGKSVMVQVASGGGTHENVPLLLAIPAFGDPFQHLHMLGFGDVALPGLLISYLRRYDVLSKKPLRVGYFAPAVVGYFIGLSVCMVALLLMKMGQPAMLYLVPCTLGTTLVLARRRGELASIWQGVPAGAAGGARDALAAPAQPASTSLASFA